MLEMFKIWLGLEIFVLLFSIQVFLDEKIDPISGKSVGNRFKYSRKSLEKFFRRMLVGLFSSAIVAFLLSVVNDSIHKETEKLNKESQNICNFIKGKKIIDKNKNRNLILENNIELEVDKKTYLKAVIGQTLEKDINNKECLDISENYLNYKR